MNWVTQQAVQSLQNRKQIKCQGTPPHVFCNDIAYQLTFTYSKSTIETVKKGVIYVQS